MMSKVTSVRPSIWLSLAALTAGFAVLTWRFLGLPALLGQRPTLLAVLGWVFWMSVLAVVFIWLSWVRTNEGWRWRWRRF